MLNILVAYPYMTPDILKILTDNKSQIRFVLDSGAFTAWKSGKEIDLDEYCKFIEKLPVKPWRYFTLDKIGDPEGSYKNYETMLKRGLTPIPIFTRGESVSMLETYYKTSEVVGIGGLVGTKGNKGFIKAIMHMVGKRKCHWLGFNERNFISAYKPYMCDSSSWSAAVRYASLKLYHSNGIFYQVGKKDFIKQPDRKIIDILRKYGVEPTRLSQASEWRNSGRGDCALEVVTYRSWAKYQMDIKSKLDVNFFLACASSWQVKLMLDSYKYWEVQK